jgi:hypothetical protein
MKNVKLLFQLSSTMNMCFIHFNVTPKDSSQNFRSNTRTWNTNPWSRQLENLIVTQRVKKFLAFYGTRRLITVFKTNCHCTLAWARCMQSTISHPISLNPALILSSHIRLSGTELGYGLDDQRFQTWQGLGIFPFITASRSALGTSQPPIQWVPRDLSLGVKRQGREADHSPPSRAEVKNAWSYISTPQYAFIACCSLTWLSK